MTKNEFIQEAALRLISAWANAGSFTTEELAKAAKALADDVWKQFDDEAEVLSDSSADATPSSDAEVLAAFPDNEPIQTVAKEIARLETLELEAKRAHYKTSYYQSGGLDIRFLNVCKRYDGPHIDTVKDLIDFGRHDFSDLRNIGPHTLKLIDQALDNLYNIKSW